MDRWGREIIAPIWVERGRWGFNRNQGPLAAAYQEAKDRHLAALSQATSAGGGIGDLFDVPRTPEAIHDAYRAVAAALALSRRKNPNPAPASRL
ncbi:MAG: hypothetical protein ACYDDF_08665 [Thermoplasmatota archaeon]